MAKSAAVHSKTPSGAAAGGGLARKPNSKGTGKSVIEDTPTGPTKKQIVGGHSWTGKLPVNLLHEHCAKLRWTNPNYEIRPASGKWKAVYVEISRKDAKTQQVQTVRLSVPSQLYDDAILPLVEEKVEARNVGATYALHRVSNHKNLQHVLPPTHRGIWLALEKKRKEDVKTGKQWLYEQDPFRANEEHEKAAASAAAVARAATGDQKGNGSSPSSMILSGAASRGAKAPQDAHWRNAPSIDMSKQWRAKLSSIVRRHAVKRYIVDHDRVLPADMLSRFLAEGFREAHVKEAWQYSRDEQQVLRWLLLHVPEDDVPEQFLPRDYHVGVSAEVHGAVSLAREYCIRRISARGYAAESARALMEKVTDDLGNRTAEHFAMQSLQSELCQQPQPPVPSSIIRANELWTEEVSGLAEMLHVTRAEDDLSVMVSFEQGTTPKGYKNAEMELLLPASGAPYPDQEPSISFHFDPPLPAYIKLKLTQRVAQFATTLRGDMMIFSLLCHAQEIAPDVIRMPGLLMELYNDGEKNAKDTKPAVQQNQNSSRSKNRAVRQQARSVNGIEYSRRRMDKLSLDADFVARLQQRKQLPAWKKASELLRHIGSSPVTIVTGETGSGKSTQIVQYILDEAMKRSEPVNIICTQPRRISALGLADRVAYERSSLVGDEVGYAIRGERKISENTRITFCTVGVLLRTYQLKGPSAFDEYSHIVIDEVHERSVDIDMLIIALKQVKSGLKLILMSATADVGSLVTYFEGTGAEPPPHVHIEGRTFPVTDYYLEDIVPSIISMEDAPHSKGTFEIDYLLVARLCRYLDEEKLDKGDSILIFMPGAAEIAHAIKSILMLLPNSEPIPLHASLAPAEQKRVFTRTSRRKIVVSTNVAETSITIDDVAAVIDTGRVKEMTYDSVADFTRFGEVWASRAASRQRRGRAGRVKHGVCFKLFTRAFETNKIPEFTDPEILRVSLEQVCLSTLCLGQDPHSFLQQALTPPLAGSVDLAMKDLRAIGAVDAAGELTPLGQHLSYIPADVRCAKLLLLGDILGFGACAAIIAAIISVKSPFMRRQSLSDLRLAFSGLGGDLISDCNAVSSWHARKHTMTSSELRNWCEENSLSLGTLHDVWRTAKEMASSLKPLGFYAAHKGLEPRKLEGDDVLVLQGVIASAFHPRIARAEYPSKKFVQSIGGAIEKDDDSQVVKFFSKDGRQFLHPSSALFNASISNRELMPFVSFYKRIVTTKPYMHDVTPVSCYGLLLLSTNVSIDPWGRGLVVDEYFKIKAWPKIGLIAECLRGEIEDRLREKIDNPTVNISDVEVISIIKSLIVTHGK